MPAPKCSAAAAPPGYPESPAEKRRLRRLLSNRESARRSRAKKQRLMESLRRLVAGLRAENRELASRLAAVMCHCVAIRSHSDRLLSDAAALRRRLSELRRLLIFRQLQNLTSSPCGGGAVGLMTETELVATIPLEAAPFT